MPQNEATARIKINRLLEDSGWRFFAAGGKQANIRLESAVSIRREDLDALGENFEKTECGFVDFLLLDDRGFPFIVLEAKREDLNPLEGKEQARTYARNLNCRFVILSNGNIHYLWDLERGNPNTITAFPTPVSAQSYNTVKPDPAKLVAEQVNDDYIALTQRHNYASEAAWINESERARFIESHKLRFLRPYQIRAVKRVQESVAEGKDRFLFEMATGTGKTLLAAAVIKLFLRTGNARRVLFLVDRLELEDQAWKNFVAYLANDYKAYIYKENRDDWRRAEIVVTTVQSLLFNNKYSRLFSPTDFDLIISDEAHRSIGGNARSVFDFFVGYKLGLTATPRDYLKNYEKASPNDRDPREYERRMLLDTYRTFGCENQQPTFRYSLVDGVKDGFLINPTVVDATTGVTTQLLSDQGYVVTFTDEQGQEQEDSFEQRDYEKKFFAEGTNELFCKVFLEKALRDPISNEVGKSIVFAVSQNHAAKLTQILNVMADKMYPGKYQSDFAVQVTSRIHEAQQFTINFTNNKLLGSANFLDTYRTSKARVCVTVGMMTTGYDCPDILNLGLFRPIFSPTDFIQIKGRGTRKHEFTEQLLDEDLKATIGERPKTSYKLFDFFQNCKYFEEDFNYDEIIELPRVSPGTSSDGPGPVVRIDGYERLGDDVIATITEQTIGTEGMRIDRMFFEQFEDTVREREDVASAVEAGQWDRVIDIVNKEVLNQPTQYYTLDKLRRAAAVDRRITLREILEKVFGLIPYFKSKDELLEEEFAKFVADYKPQEATSIPAIKNYFKAYLTNSQIRHIIDTRQYTDLATNPVFTTRDFRAVPDPYRVLVPNYIKDYVPLNQFAN